MTQKLIILCGPTATGKTSLALKLGERFAGEVVSIDSRQAYRGMELGTGKSVDSNQYQVARGEGFWDLTDRESGQTTRVHLYDLVPPTEELNVVRFAEKAGPVIEDIWSRGKIPMLVGGSGLYLEVLLGKVKVAGVPPNPELRQQLEGLSNEELFLQLQGLDPVRAAKVDPRSPHRLIRAIEIALGRQAAGVDSVGVVTILPPDLQPLWIGLNAPREILYQRIDQRIDAMVREGLLEEIRRLAQDYGWAAPGLNSIGYIEFKPYFEGTAPLEACVTRAKFNSHAYARRQLTWFRRNKEIRWFDINQEGFDVEIGRLVESYLADGHHD